LVLAKSLPVSDGIRSRKSCMCRRHPTKISFRPPELGTVERAMKRVRHGRYVLIPASDKTHGHFTRTRPQLRNSSLLTRRWRGLDSNFPYADDASNSCSDSSQLDPPSVSSACTARSATSSAFNATSSPDPHCGSSAPKLLQSGEMPSQRHERMARLGFRCMPDGVAVTKPLSPLPDPSRQAAGQVRGGL
jgi:hypothetical protein